MIFRHLFCISMIIFPAFSASAQTNCSNIDGLNDAGEAFCEALNFSDRGFPKVVLTDDDDGCDDGDPAWMPSGFFDQLAAGNSATISTWSGGGIFSDDDGCDGDPAWMPALDYPALVSVQKNSVTVWREGTVFSEQTLDALLDQTRHGNPSSDVGYSLEYYEVDLNSLPDPYLGLNDDLGVILRRRTADEIIYFSIPRE